MKAVGQQQREELVETKALLQGTVGHRQVEDGIRHPTQSPTEDTQSLTRGAGLIVALLLSLGLWWAIWLTLSSLASAWLS
jgi:hypothetical protein